MLTRLYADNYKCLVNFELRFKDVTLLLGTNGAGKSSVLDVVYRLKQLLVDGRRIGDAEVFPARTRTRGGQRDIQTIALDVDLDGELFQYKLEVEHEEGDTGRARVRLESLKTSGGALFHCSLGDAQLYRDDHSEGPRLPVDWTESFLGRVSAGRSNMRLTRFMDFVRRLVICRLHPVGFLPNARRESARLDRDGGNFAAWYRHLVQEHTGQIQEMISKLRTVIDGFRGLRLEKAGSDTRTMLVEFVDDGGDSLQLDEVSDGERILLVLYMLLGMAADQPFTLLIDEPDNFLALPEIQPWLIALADACGDSRHQAVICSHHPELIDYFGVENGTLLERTNGGVTTVRAASSLDAGDGLRLSERIARGWIEPASGDAP